MSDYSEEVVQDAQLLCEMLATSVTNVYVALSLVGENSGYASLDACVQSENPELRGFLGELLDALEGARASCESLTDLFGEHVGLGYHLRFWSGMQDNWSRLFGPDLSYRSYAELLADVHAFSSWIDRIKDMLDACFEETVEVVH